MDEKSQWIMMMMMMMGGTLAHTIPIATANQLFIIVNSTVSMWRQVRHLEFVSSLWELSHSHCLFVYRNYTGHGEKRAPCKLSIARVT